VLRFSPHLVNNERWTLCSKVGRKVLADIGPDSRWGERLKAHFNAHPTINLRAMQFPANWQTRSPWI